MELKKSSDQLQDSEEAENDDEGYCFCMCNWLLEQLSMLDNGDSLLALNFDDSNILIDG